LVSFARAFCGLILACGFIEDEKERPCSSLLWKSDHDRCSISHTVPRRGGPSPRAGRWGRSSTASSSCRPVPVVFSVDATLRIFNLVFHVE